MATGASELTTTPAWQSLAATLADMLSQLFQTTVASTPVPLAMPDPAFASSITMSDVEHQIDLAVGIIADKACTIQIAEQIFGDASFAEDESMIADIIAELSNLAMGCLKTSFSNDGFVFSGGIPDAHNLQSLHQFLAPYGTQRASAFEASGLGLIILVGLKRKRPHYVRADRLNEGMVLTEDFLTKTGLILLRSGTRLTSNYAGRLARCDPERIIRVCDPSQE